MPQKIDPNTFMVKFDVINLYCNIPLKLGKQAILFWIEKYPGTLHLRFNKILVTDDIEQIMNNNSFKFDNKNYTQTLGTIIRTKMALTYATITLEYLEEKSSWNHAEKNTVTIKKGFY